MAGKSEGGEHLQTPGQLRSRSGRLYAFSELAEVEATLREMAAGDAPLAVALERQPGTKESRWAHRLGPEPAREFPSSTTVPPPQPSTDPGLSERLEAVERRVEELARELASLQEELGS